LESGYAFKPCHFALSIIVNACHLDVTAVLVAISLLNLVNAIDDIILGGAALGSILAHHIFGSIIWSSHLQTKNIQMIWG
jgi:hypothetical protein